MWLSHDSGGTTQWDRLTDIIVLPARAHAACTRKSPVRTVANRALIVRLDQYVINNPEPQGAGPISASHTENRNGQAVGGRSHRGRRPLHQVHVRSRRRRRRDGRRVLCRGWLAREPGCRQMRRSPGYPRVRASIRALSRERLTVASRDLQSAHRCRRRPGARALLSDCVSHARGHEPIARAGLVRLRARQDRRGLAVPAARRRARPRLHARGYLGFVEAARQRRLPRILIFHAQAGEYAAALRARVVHADAYSTSDEREFSERLPEAEVLIAHRFPVGALNAAAKLRWIQVTSAGTEFLEPARGQLARVIVTNGRGLHAAPIADYVMTTAVMLQSSFAQFIRNQAAKRWRRRPVPILAGKTLGIVGLGSIGQEIARRAAASGMDVVGVRRSGAPMDGVRRVFAPDRLHAFLACCDFVVLAVPATESTRALLGEAQFEAMKRSAYVINIARGTVIDEPALIGAL